MISKLLRMNIFYNCFIFLFICVFLKFGNSLVTAGAQRLSSLADAGLIEVAVVVASKIVDFAFLCLETRWRCPNLRLPSGSTVSNLLMASMLGWKSLMPE